MPVNLQLILTNKLCVYVPQQTNIIYQIKLKYICFFVLFCFLLKGKQVQVHKQHSIKHRQTCKLLHLTLPGRL